MEFVLIVLAIIGGWAVAQWIGVIVVVAFLATSLANTALRMRSPHARTMRALSRELRELPEDSILHIHSVRTDMAHPKTDDED
jgi:hypothetical protein